ncbi:hypothetical protein FJZ48_02420 [Candidatus Uhrbacteria bacterium]|nr:hypothetical protein [Candidatus Uhrbacteria bacterium]
MSYSFSFEQYPVKEIDEFWQEFINGKFVLRIDQGLRHAKETTAEAEKMPMGSQATFYENREEWIQGQKNLENVQRARFQEQLWEEFRKQTEEVEHELSLTKDKKKWESLATAYMELFSEAIKRFFIPECDGYSESARDLDYRFLAHLFQAVNNKELDDVEIMPTTEQWKQFFLELKSDFVEKEFQAFCEEQRIPKEEQEALKTFCLKLLFIVRDFLRTCLQRGWELHFESEYWNREDSDRRKKQHQKQLIQALVETRSK